MGFDQGRIHEGSRPVPGQTPARLGSIFLFKKQIPGQQPVCRLPVKSHRALMEAPTSLMLPQAGAPDPDFRIDSIRFNSDHGLLECDEMLEY